MCLHEKPFELETSEDITKVFRNEEMEDEEMEFMDGTWKKEINTWEELVGNNLLNQEAVIEGAVHSIRNMGDVAFIILRRREGLFQTVYENEMATLKKIEYKIGEKWIRLVPVNPSYPSIMINEDDLDADVWAKFTFKDFV